MENSCTGGSCEYKGGSYVVHTGTRGGKYIIVGKGPKRRKVYLKK